MHLGISISSSHDVTDHRLGSRWMVERTAMARDSGLDSLSFGDSHARPAPYYQGVPTLGRALAEWDIDRPAGCLFLLPLWHPVIVAEQVATLASLLDAPFLLQVGVGGGREQFDAMGADLRTRGRDTDESIRVIKQLLAGAATDSERFGLLGAATRPLPPVAVEWWIGAAAPAALERAGREGDAWYAGPEVDPAQLPAMLDIYRAACENAGRRSRAIRRKDVIVLRDESRARRLGDDLMAAGYRGMSQNAVAYGGVDAVAEQLQADHERGFDDFIVRCMTVDQTDALETIELCGEVRTRLA